MGVRQGEFETGIGGQGRMQQVVAQLGRRLGTVTMATLHNNSSNLGMDALRQQKKALRTVVRRELRNFSPDTKRQEGERRIFLLDFQFAIDLSRLLWNVGVRAM